MSNYRAGDIIRLTRIAIGMTQEDYAGEYCGVQTLHRIENGKVAVKKEILIGVIGKNEPYTRANLCSLCWKKYGAFGGKNLFRGCHA